MRTYSTPMLWFTAWVLAMFGGRTASLKLRGMAERDLRDDVGEAPDASCFDIARPMVVERVA
jgi:hypothetical protein